MGYTPEVLEDIHKHVQGSGLLHNTFDCSICIYYRSLWVEA